MGDLELFHAKVTKMSPRESFGNISFIGDDTHYLCSSWASCQKFISIWAT